MATWAEIFQRAQTALVSGHHFGHLITYTEAAQRELGLSSKETPSLARLILLSKQAMSMQQGGAKAASTSIPELDLSEKEEKKVKVEPLPEPLPDLLAVEAVPEAPLTETVEEALETKTDPPSEENEPTQEIPPPPPSPEEPEATVVEEEKKTEQEPATTTKSGKGSKKAR